jgi:hypothetical protein
MPRVRRKQPPLHKVVVDTNILWDKDKKLPVTKVFDEFWAKNSPLIPMTLAVPEVVFGELQFQQSTSALKALSNISENFLELSGITCSNYVHKLNETTIKKQVRAKLEKWLSSQSGKILPTPISSIEWGAIIDSAIWRKPPFTFDPKDPKNEKGFRDALILETLIHECSTAIKDQTIIFVCNDFLLRTTADKKLKSSKSFLAFESLEDFESYINLTQQQFTNAFVKSIQNHARDKFYSKGDPNCIYLKNALGELIPEKHLSTGLANNASSNIKSIKRLIWIKSTQFSKLEGVREFHWISRVDVVSLVDQSPGLGLIAIYTNPQRKIQIVGIDVKWRSNVKTDGRFHDISMDSTEQIGVELIDATEDNLKKWRLE